MREIKFRAWNKEHGEMIFSSREAVFDKREFYPFCFTVGFSHYPLDGWEIMEFTGLLDRHSKEIYEGDVVRIYGSISRDDPAYGVYEPIARIEWGDDGAYELISDEGKFIGTMQYNTKHLEVIGNIYENPNLLKGGE